MSERMSRYHEQQPNVPDFSPYTEVLTTLADKMQQEEARRGKPIFRKIPLGSDDELNSLKQALKESPLGAIMRHPRKAFNSFSAETKSTYIALMSDKSSWEREVYKNPDPKQPNTVIKSPGWETKVGISLGYTDGKHRAIQTIWMSVDSNNSHPMLQRVVLKRQSDKINWTDPIPATEEQAKSFVTMAQKLDEIYQAQERRERGDPYDWFPNQS